MSDQLQELGIRLIEGYGADQLALRPDLYVIGNVVSRVHLANGQPKFPLMEAIMDARLPYISGPQWLAEHVLKQRWTLCVAGTHGKTTTTSMLAWILERAGQTPGFLVGGVPMGFDISARLGNPEHRFVIEADEYDTAFFDKRSKFVHYRPYTAVLNNLEFDHADIFPDLAAIERQFHHLVRTVPQAGRIVVNAGSQALARVLAQGCWSSQVRFGLDQANEQGAFWAQGLPGDFAVMEGTGKDSQQVGHVRWNMTGVHNQMNALAAIAASQHAGVDPALACDALSNFPGVRRRLELCGKVPVSGGEVTVYDDFAHHPTAIRTTIDGLRQQLDTQGHQAQRILAVFEPRSNTMKLGSMKAQLPWALENAALAFCYAQGLDWDAAQVLAPMGERAYVAHSINQLAEQVVAAARAGDNILCMSNGGFGGVQHKLMAMLAGSNVQQA
jgi:UDP-N-acetylmuramate: L-alanyl-gamma-D-glutamyl-meso-diaminopimelate ligase